jgi:hypothetical protein
MASLDQQQKLNRMTTNKPLLGWETKVLQKIIDHGAFTYHIIPVAVIADKNSWYSRYQVEQVLQIDRKTINQYIKEGVLKRRQIAGSGKQLHFELFLVSENEKMLNPKSA